MHAKLDSGSTFNEKNFQLTYLPSSFPIQENLSTQSDHTEQ